MAEFKPDLVLDVDDLDRLLKPMSRKINSDASTVVDLPQLVHQEIPEEIVPIPERVLVSAHPAPINMYMTRITANFVALNFKYAPFVALNYLCMKYGMKFAVAFYDRDEIAAKWIYFKFYGYFTAFKTEKVEGVPSDQLHSVGERRHDLVHHLIADGSQPDLFLTLEIEEFCKMDKHSGDVYVHFIDNYKYTYLNASYMPVRCPSNNAMTFFLTFAYVKEKRKDETISYIRCDMVFTDAGVNLQFMIEWLRKMLNIFFTDHIVVASNGMHPKSTYGMRLVLFYVAPIRQHLKFSDNLKDSFPRENITFTELGQNLSTHVKLEIYYDSGKQLCNAFNCSGVFRKYYDYANFQGGVKRIKHNQRRRSVTDDIMMIHCSLCCTRGCKNPYSTCCSKLNHCLGMTLVAGMTANNGHLDCKKTQAIKFQARETHIISNIPKDACVFYQVFHNHAFISEYSVDCGEKRYQSEI